MKIKLNFIALILIGSLISSCDKDDFKYQNDFENSREAWLDFKSSSNNSYKYEVVHSSWTGFSSTTTITVSEGTIIQRHFKLSVPDGESNNIPEEKLEWTEGENEIGSHEDSGAEPLTLDEVYEKAKKEWLIERKNATTYFEAKNNGLISLCGYVENNCVDDCFIGITIKSIESI